MGKTITITNGERILVMDLMKLLTELDASDVIRTDDNEMTKYDVIFQIRANGSEELKTLFQLVDQCIDAGILDDVSVNDDDVLGAFYELTYSDHGNDAMDVVYHELGYDY